METKKLQIRDVFCFDLNTEDTKKAIINFAEHSVIDLLETNAMCWDFEAFTTEQDFHDECKSSLTGLSASLQLSDDTYLEVKYDAFCEFIRNTTDESEVGLGGVGEISGIENSWFEVTNLFYITADGSELDLSECEELKEYLYKNINI